MKDFIVYHNPDSMGSSAGELTELSVVTNKPVSNIKGDRIWLLTGEGHPRRFYLCAWFIADHVDRGDDSEFGTLIRGSEGKLFRPMRELTSEEWFPDLKRSQGNFAFGLQTISDSRFVRALEQVADVKSRNAPVLSPSTFVEVFERFRDAVASDKGSDGPFRSFTTGLPYFEESYKEEVYHYARRLLDARRWKKSQIGSGQILERVIGAIEIDRDNTLRNNMVQWTARWGEGGKAHKEILAARNNTDARKEIEQLFFSFFRERLDPETAFEAFAQKFGRHYDLLGYLMFIHDWDEFMPVKPTLFESAFGMLGIPLAMSGKASWENYSAFLSRLREVQAMLTAVNVPAVRLIDAHTFCWMLTSLKLSAPVVVRGPEYRTLIPEPGVAPVRSSDGPPLESENEIDYEGRLRMGALAQSIVLDAERDRLRAAGQPHLADKVKDVSSNAFLGYDIASFTTDGRQKPIEVKAAARRGDSLRFFLSAHEWRRSKGLSDYTFAIVADITVVPIIHEFAGTDLPDESMYPANYEIRLRAPDRRAV